MGEATVGMAAVMEATVVTVVMVLLTTHLAVVASMRSTPTAAVWLTTGRGTIWRIWRISMQTAVSILLMSRRSMKLRAITYWLVITRLPRILAIG